MTKKHITDMTNGLLFEAIRREEKRLPQNSELLKQLSAEFERRSDANIIQ